MKILCTILCGVVFASAQSTSSADPVARLIQRLATGQEKLDVSAGPLGYLPSLLRSLKVPVDSQMLVFSKTSLQAYKISPAKPRALYFNDSISVGFVQGGDVIELAAYSAEQGIVFYTLDAKNTTQPVFQRTDQQCFSCHGREPRTSLVVNSVIPNKTGEPLILLGTIEPVHVDHRTPFEKRWGGWYVSGTHGAQMHMGNAVAPDPFRPVDLQTQGTTNLTSLKSKVNTSPYLASSSDIVALMTFEHQQEMVNLIARLNRAERAHIKVNDAIEEMLPYMLFVDEAPLKYPVKGVSTFTETFPQHGPRDSKGRSLRDFDLNTRLFRYPLSYMIYSDVYATIPAALRERIGQRLRQILSADDPGEPYSRISREDRQTILEILQETHGLNADLP